MSISMLFVQEFINVHSFAQKPVDGTSVDNDLHKIQQNLFDFLW